MTPLLTCKDFLRELSDYLDDSLDPDLRAELAKHVKECPNCWVVCDTTKKTLQVFKGMEAKQVPESLRERVWAVLQRKIAAEGGGCCGKKKQPEASSATSADQD